MMKGGIRFVVSRPGAWRAPAASGTTEEWFSAGGDAFWIGLEGGWRSLAGVGTSSQANRLD